MGYFSSDYDLSGWGSGSSTGTLDRQTADGTPNETASGFFGMLQDAVKTGVNGYIAVRQAQASNSQPETTFEQRVVPDNNYTQAAAQAVGKMPDWMMMMLIGGAILGVVLLVKD